MIEQKKLIVSHAPFWHIGNRVTGRSYHTMLAALPAVLAGLVYYGVPTIAVVGLSVATAMLWELLINKVMKKSPTIGDGNAALIGLLLAMVFPATMPWWAVITGTFIAVVIGKQIFGGIGSNAFNPVALAVAIMMVSWKDLFDFNGMLLNYDFNFAAVYPLTVAKNFGAASVESFSPADLIMGRQAGAIGATFGLGLIIGGIYLMIRGFIRWEIALSFLAGVYITAMLFNIADPVRFAEPGFHVLTGYTLIGAFFLATDDASSPVWPVPMLIYGAAGGIMTVLIRNIGVNLDGVILAILVINLIGPLLDNIRPKALGKVM
jgi:electron transport complex protein RnfD